MKLKLNNVRASFVRIFTPEEFNGDGNPKFSCVFILPKDHPQIAEIKKAMTAVAKEKWGDKAEAIYKQLQANNKLALADGDLKPELEGYPGNYFISSSSKQRPLVIDANKEPLVEADGKPYSGCYVNAIVEFWAQDNNYGKRINAQLKGVQFYRDGDAFSGGGVASADEFDVVAEGADAEEFADFV